MQKPLLHFHYSGWNPESTDISGFIPFLKSKVPTGMYSVKVWNILSNTFKLAAEIHKDDFRKSDGRAYFNHNIEIMLSELQSFQTNNIELGDKYDLLGDFLVYALHDAPEDHPERWQEIFNGLTEILQDELLVLQLFRDILVLATGGIKFKARKELVKFFFKNYNEDILSASVSVADTEKSKLLLEIVKILNPVDPLFKLENESEKYSEAKGSEEYVRLHSAIELYKYDILLKKDKYKNRPDEVLYSDEYVGLGNYIFFNKADTRRKTKDMVNNISDLKQMELRKSGYVETRRIKAYILAVKLKHFGMWDQLIELQEAFERQDCSPLTDAEVTVRLDKIEEGKMD